MTDIWIRPECVKESITENTVAYKPVWFLAPFVIIIVNCYVFLFLYAFLSFMLKCTLYLYHCPFYDDQVNKNYT